MARRTRPHSPRMDAWRLTRRLRARTSGSAAVGLTQPLLCLSVYFKQHRDHYYACLQRVRTDGDWEGWLPLFLEAVRDVASEATTTTQKIVKMIEADRLKLLGLGRATATALALHEYAIKRMVVSAPRAASTLGMSEPPIYKAIGHLEDLGILVEITGQARNRIYSYQEYFRLLAEDSGSIDSAKVSA